MKKHPLKNSPAVKSHHPDKYLGFIILMAVAMSLVALSIDAILPAFDAIKQDLNVSNANDIQLMVSVLFVGMGVGIIFYGPLADAYGRKKTFYIGFALFIIGTICSIITEDYQLMLIGRFVQGLGVAAFRVLTMTMIRDRFEGAMVAKMMSLMMMIFVTVPTLAPSFGQLVLLFGDWRMIFICFLVITLIVAAFFTFMQEETLKEEYRRPLSFKNIGNGVKEVFSHTESRNYSIAVGLIFAGFINYLNSAQQIFQIQYQTGTLFPIYFGTVAFAFGACSLLNSKLVQHFTLKKLCLYAFAGIILVTVPFYALSYYYAGTPPLFSLLIYLYLISGFAAILVSNLTTLSLLPMGHLAGMAASLVAAIGTFVGAGVGTFFSQQYDGTLYSLVGGYLAVSIIATLIILYTNHVTKNEDDDAQSNARKEQDALKNLPLTNIE